MAHHNRPDWTFFFKYLLVSDIFLYFSYIVELREKKFWIQFLKNWFSELTGSLRLLASNTLVVMSHPLILAAVMCLIRIEISKIFFFLNVVKGEFRCSRAGWVILLVWEYCVAAGFFKVRTSLFESLFPPEHYKLTHYLFSTPYWKKINTIFSFLTKISVSFWDEHLQCVWRRCCDMLSVIIVIYTEPPPVNTSAYFRVKSPLRPFFKLFWNDRNISGLKSWPTSVRWIFFFLAGM